MNSLPEVMRVLTSQAETGAVTLALPQDVQTEAFDYPVELFEDRVWYIPRPAPGPDAAGARRRTDPREQEAAHRRGRRCALQRSARSTGKIRRRDRHSRGRDARRAKARCVTIIRRISAPSA